MPHSLAEAVFCLLDLTFHYIFSSTWPGTYVCLRSTSEGGRWQCVHLTVMLSQCWYPFPHLFYGQNQTGDHFWRSPSSDTLFPLPLLSLCFSLFLSFFFTFVLPFWSFEKTPFFSPAHCYFTAMKPRARHWILMNFSSILVYKMGIIGTIPTLQDHGKI